MPPDTSRRICPRFLFLPARNQPPGEGRGGSHMPGREGHMLGDLHGVAVRGKWEEWSPSSDNIIAGHVVRARSRRSRMVVVLSVLVARMSIHRYGDTRRGPDGPGALRSSCNLSRPFAVKPAHLWCCRKPSIARHMPAGPAGDERARLPSDETSPAAAGCFAYDEREGPAAAAMSPSQFVGRNPSCRRCPGEGRGAAYSLA
jgi:hypothetical protein